LWEQIQSNRRRTVFVVTAMGVLLILIGMAVASVLSTAPGALLVGGAVALGLWLVMWLVTIGNGDDILMQMAGAREIRHKDHPVLVNVVEEMTIAAGLSKRPRVFLVDDPSPNAFATGRDPEKAAVAVTTGLLRVLDRDELQGVVAHEIGHIKNRDVALMTTAGIMLGAIVLLAEIGLRAMWFSGGGMRRSRSSSDQGGGAQAIIMVIAILLMILAPILAQLIYYALSRRREYLADASSAMFTRYPEGLASALEKISGSHRPLADQSKVTAPMYIVRPLRPDERRSATSAFATHPPIAERVRILRSMAGGADYRAYDQAYAGVRGRRIVGPQTLEETRHVALRAAGEADVSSKPERRRAASNAFLSASGYGIRQCSDCGASLKIPPSMAERVTSCPRCGGDLGPWTD